jgi:ankyrin repeat protein
MRRLPARPNVGHLKKQAKDLLNLYRRGDTEAIGRIRQALPAARGLTDAGIAGLGLRLHDMHSCIAREHGLPSWTDLKRLVEASTAAGVDAVVAGWLRLVYAADIAGGMNRERPQTAARMLQDHPALASGDPYLACAAGEEAVLRQAARDDAAWVNRPGGLLKLPPLVAVTHSTLVRLPVYRDRLHACARFLLQAGADPNGSVGSRWPPDSLDKPSDVYRLSALYGAAGRNHDAELTRLLLQAGADPNDGESLYHALESVACARFLLDAGARIAESNAMYRVLDLDSIAALRLLLAHGGNPNEPPPGPPTADWGSPLLWAIRRRRSAAHVEALLQAGADPLATTPDGTAAHVWASRFGLADVAGALRKAAGAAGPVPEAERFLAACAGADAAAAEGMLARSPQLLRGLSEAQLRLLPELAAGGCGEAVRVMVRLGWPIAVRGGDWSGSALNHAVFRGDAGLARFLLEHGASWKEEHGYGDNVSGTLGWASCNEPVEGGDWPGCAEALLDHGMPAPRPDPAGPDPAGDPAGSGTVVLDGRRKRFSEAVTEVLLEAARRS